MSQRKGLDESQERIQEAEWRARLLQEIDALDGYDQIIGHTLTHSAPPPPDILTRLSQRASIILGKFPKEDLRVARHFYNTRQLIAFWKHYCELIDNCVNGGTETEPLPLVSISLDPTNKKITLQPVPKHLLTAGRFIRTNEDALHPTFRFIAPGKETPHPDALTRRQDALDSLEGRLTYAVQTAFQSSSILYKLFLHMERRSESEIWDYYKIHIFLDCFLYQQQKGHTRTSKFELIFFSNNLRELMIWLASAAKKDTHASDTDVDAFLERQTKYYLALSQRITLEENEILNTHKELLRYDSDSGTVVLGSAPDELLAESRNLYECLGISSIGCPFGRTKGINGNALLEIYTYYDRLFARITKSSWEFKWLIGEPQG